MNWDWEKLQQQKKSPFGDGNFKPPSGMNDMFEKIKNKNIKFPSAGPLVIIIMIIVFILGSSCFFTVDVDEVGVIQRFGKFIRIAQPGLNLKFPKGIETISKVKVRYVWKEEFGIRTSQPSTPSRFIDAAYDDESLMLTGDLNVAIVPWIVQYRITDPYNYLFKVANVRSTLRDLAEASMRMVVGDRSINEVISKREEIADAAIVLLQKELDDAETGIKITTIEMKRTNVPEPVQPSFNEVNQATQEREKMIYQAKEQYNKVIPAAHGDAEKTVRSAEGYALDRVNRAKGDSARFMALFKEYHREPDVMRRRLYLETISEVFPNLGTKYIMDSSQQGILPLINLTSEKNKGDQK